MNAPVALASGQPAQFRDTRFTVPSIRCAGCIAKIERELPKLDGVERARVNFSAKRVAIHHSASLDDVDLTKALRAIGFEAQPVSENPLARDDADTRMILRAVAVAGFGMMNIMLLSISVWSGASGATRDLFHWLSAIIAIPVIAYAGRPFFASALMALRYGRTNMDVPISIGVLLATALSLYETATSGAHAYFESAVMLLFFLLCGRALDATMRTRTRAGIGALLGRIGKSASVFQPDGSCLRVSAEELQSGMLVLVAAGEALAADGVVEQGDGAVDNAMLTGETTPQTVGAGIEVHAGAINVLGPLHVRLTAVAGDTALAEIARLMDEAGQSRSLYVRIADRASQLYAPVVHSLAALAFIAWMLAGAGWHQSLVIAIAVLIITCPCAMGLAVPAAQVVASGALIKRGLLVKDGSALERLAEVDVALFDKTGTLTLGAPRPDISALDDTTRSIALGLTQASRHPLSQGLAEALISEGVKAAIVEEIEEQSGQGLTGRWEQAAVSIGQPQTAQDGMASELTVGDLHWTLRFNDPVRGDARQTIDRLQSLGIESRILSGDISQSVKRVASDLGVPAQAGASPQKKLALLEGLKADGHKPLMVGDGINDGPALAAAHASIAPSTASDASQQAADAVFIGEKLAPVAFAVTIARQTMRIVRQNFTFAIGYNILAIPLALFGMVTPLIAAIAMSVSSLVVVGNSLRLARSGKDET